MSTLVAALNQQCENLKALHDMLERELQLIAGRDPEALLALVAEKSDLLDSIQALDAETAKQFPSAQKQEELSFEENKLVNQSRDLVEKCKYSTAINQKAVEQGQVKLAHLRQLIVDVRAKESLTYDKSGIKKGGLSGKGITA